ncbi:MAG: TIGR00341 family protein [Saprospiraceae bacterium]|nr:TIGR00341 family protein [Saprospiraceae bacterium]
MSLRLIEIVATDGKEEKVKEILKNADIDSILEWTVGEESVLIRSVIPLEKVEGITDDIKSLIDGGDVQRLWLSHLEAVLPTPEEEKSEEKKEEKVKLGFFRLSKEELRQDIREGGRLDFNFVALIFLSSLVAVIGILQDNLAIIIGAMAIAPFLGPNIALAFGTTLADFKIIKQAINTALVGTAAAVVIGVVWGFFDPAVADITLPNPLRYRDFLLAVSCGLVAVLSIMTQQATSLVGVVIAAALLPPLMRSGLFLGAQMWIPALHSFLNFFTFIIFINLAGIAAFNLAGLRPYSWWEKENAKKYTKRAVLIWLVVLALLVAILVFSPESAKDAQNLF